MIIATLTFGKPGWLSFWVSSHHSPEETMKTTAYLASDLPTLRQAEPFALPTFALQTSTPLSPIGGSHSTQKEELRHILLGSPGAIRQTIYLLHTMNYAEPVLWSPIMAVGEQLIIRPEQGEAISLLRRSL